ncbi:MAG TPA: type II secretion system F family protein [Nitrospiraceae bacterium]|jgi:tight adherence protein C|nr:type II secretion system F family protein [Nitrospiraceae bacterium]
MDVPLIVALVTFLAVVLASSAVFLYFNSREALQTWRRRADGASGTTESEGGPTGMAEMLKEQLQVVLEWFGKFNQSSNVEEVRATRRQLINAGYRSAKAPIFFLGAKLLLVIVMVGLLALIPAKMLGFPSALILTFYYVMAAACGYYAPALWLRRAIGSRKDALQRAIPNALDLMVVCVEAGLGLDQAIGRVGDEVKLAHPELSDELNLLALELRTGMSRQEALRNLAHRTDLEEVRNLVALLIQTDRFGTSIGQALRVHADAMRTTRRLKAEELAAKLPVKMLLPLIFFIFPCMFIVLLGPAAIQMIRVLFPALGGN